MEKIVALLSIVLVVCLVACTGESESVEDQSPPEPTVTLEPPSSTPAPPTAISEPPTETSVPPTMNAMEIAMTEQALAMEVATPLPTWTPWPTPSTQIEVTWDGNECIVTGPSVVPVGYHEFIWKDHTDHGYGLAVRYLHEGYTYQDLLDVQGEPGRLISQPSWVEEIDGRYRRDDTISAEILTFHLNRGGNYDIHFWDTNSLWVCGGLTAVGDPEAYEVTFDGVGCTYSGPTELPAGDHSFVFRDLSDQKQQLWSGRILDDHTYQDLLDLQNEPGEFIPQPLWIVHPPQINKEWYESVGAEVYTWSFVEEGEHELSAGTFSPLSVWFCDSFHIVEAPDE